MPEPEHQRFLESKARAGLGEAKAQYDVGLRYAHGFGVESDDAEAFNWFYKSAEQNYAPAQNDLGDCFAYGFGTERSPEAVLWYRKAAEQNYAEAQFNLGKAFATGRGVSKDSVEAYAWLILAGAYEDAGKARTELEREMSSEQIAKGKERSEALRAELESQTE